ncbi:hypothetical protein WA026_022675, partial [Henosepilachna vigintioctopunctata]
ITLFDWTTILAPQAEVQYNNFHNTLMKIFEESFPERKVKVIERKKYKYTKSIKQLKNKVDAAGTIYRTKKDDNSKKLYEALKNKLRECIAESVKSGNNKKLKSAVNKLQGIWQLIKQETSKKSPKATGATITADEMNDYLTSIGNRIQDAAQRSPHESIDLLKHTNIHVTNSMYLYQVTEDEVIGISKKLKTKYSRDIHGMTVALLKQIVPHVSHVLC